MVKCEDAALKVVAAVPEVLIIKPSLVKDNFGNKLLCIHTYMHIYIHTDIHTYIHTYILYIRVYPITYLD